MASNYTEHYGLCQWEATDQVQREEFNQDNVKVSMTLQHIEKSVTEHDEVLKTHDTALAKKGNCRIQLTSYVGNGKDGSEFKNSVTFSEKPFLILILSGNGGYGFFPADASAGLTSSETSNASVYVTWTDTKLTWYAANSSSQQMNERNVHYQVIMFLPLK